MHVFCFVPMMLHLSMLTGVWVYASEKQLCICKHRIVGDSVATESARSNCLHSCEGMKVSLWHISKQDLLTQPEIVLAVARET